MKKILVIASVSIALFLSSSVIASPDVDLKGAVPGKWTMDMDAAVKVASAKKLPILINFSGSDWCGWCKIMEKNVFSKKDWQEYAKENVMMVLIDFPKDSSIVPEKYVERNQKLKAKYNVSGFPTFIVLDDDSLTQLGRLGAGRDKTPATFIAELSKLSRYRPASVAKYAKTLKPKDKAAYLSVVNQMSANSKAIASEQDKVAEAEQKIEKLEAELAELKVKAKDIRVANLGGEAVAEYNKLKADFEAAQTKIKDWMASQPERNEENQKKFQSMSGAIQELSEKLSDY